MTATFSIAEEFESLPSNLQAQVIDFIKFLKFTHRRPNPLPVEQENEEEEKEDDLDFSEAELAELDRRWEEYEINPDSAISIEVLSKQIQEKYGLPNHFGQRRGARNQ